MVDIVAYHPSHLPEIHLQEMQQYFYDKVSDATYAVDLAFLGEAWTALSGNRVLGCAGFFEYWPGRAAVWAVLADNIGPAMTTIHRRVLREIKARNYARLEAIVLPALEVDETGMVNLPSLPVGHLWANMLGFKVECPIMERYTPDGKNATLYVRMGE